MYFQLLTSGTEKFNTKPKKGIEFLQEHGLLSTPLNPVEIATFLRENPLLDKKMIGEFISNRNNVDVLNSFIKYIYPYVLIEICVIFVLSIYNY